MGTQRNRTWAQLVAEFPDNILKLISAEASRDLAVSAMGYNALVDPTMFNDRFDTAGIGQFFDTGSRWNNTTLGTIWACLDGTPGLAQWRLLYPAGGGGGGVITLTCVLGTTGPFGHGAQMGDAQSWGDEPTVGKIANYSVVQADRGSLINFFGDGITLTFPHAVGFLNGWYVDVLSTLGSSGIRTFSDGGDGPRLTGGGLSWANKGGGPSLIHSFGDLIGGNFRVTTDGTNFFFRGLEYYKAAKFETPAVGLTTFDQPLGPWAATLETPLGMLGNNLAGLFLDPLQPTHIVAPVLGFYRFRMRLRFLLNNHDVTSTCIGVNLNYTVSNGDSAFDECQLAVPNPWIYPPAQQPIQDVIYQIEIADEIYLDAGDYFELTATPVNLADPLNPPGLSVQRLTVQYLGT